MKNDFELLCDKMNKCCRKQCRNEIICAKNLVKDYANGDINKILKIKAESTSISFFDYIVGLLTFATFAVTTISLSMEIFNNYNHSRCLVILIIVLMIISPLYIGMKMFSNVRKYESYMVIAIEEVETEYRNSVIKK